MTNQDIINIKINVLLQRNPEAIKRHFYRHLKPFYANYIAMDNDNTLCLFEKLPYIEYLLSGAPQTWMNTNSSPFVTLGTQSDIIIFPPNINWKQAHLKITPIYITHTSHKSFGGINNHD